MTTLPEPDQRYTTPPRQRIVNTGCPVAPRREARQDNFNVIARPIVQQPRLSAAIVGMGTHMLGVRRKLVFSFPGEFDCKLTPNCKPKKDHYRDDDNNNSPASSSKMVRCGI